MEDMNVFDRHSKGNARDAKVALVEVAATVIGKYVITQERLNSELSGGNVHGKDEHCLACKVHLLTKRMARLDSQLGQIAKTYEMLFDEPLDTKAITAKAAKEFYPLIHKDIPEFSQEEVFNRVITGRGTTHTTSNRRTETHEAGIYFPDGTPQEVKDIASMIKNSLGAKGKDVEVRVLDFMGGASESTYGVNPKDYHGDMEGFIKAVKRAKKAHDAKTPAGEDGTKPATAHVVSETGPTTSAGTHNGTPGTSSSNGSQSTKDTKGTDKGPKK